MIWLRERGWTVDVVERWIAPARKRSDFFGFADLIAVRQHRTFAIQCSTGDNHAAHLDKIVNHRLARIWLQPPSNGILLCTWYRYAKPVNGRWWRPRWQQIKPTHLVPGK